uniref:RusA family crossover junction endodeoxyribonuclease n=1 Tax=Burkholderia ambifaria TaxID=152480 RepID=UPI0015890B54
MTQQPLIGAPVAAQRVEFVVPGTPVAKGRPKFARRGAHVTTYTPEKTERYENLVKLAARAAMRSTEPYAGPIRLIVHIG